LGWIFRVCFRLGRLHFSYNALPPKPPVQTSDSSQKFDPILEILPAGQPDLLEKLPGDDDPPVLLVLSRLLIVELDEVPDVEGGDAPFFLDGKGELLAVRFTLPLQVLGMDDIIPPLPQGMRQPGVDILVQK